MWVWMNQADIDTINKKLDAILAQLGVDHRLLAALVHPFRNQIAVFAPKSLLSFFAGVHFFLAPMS